MSLLSAMAVRWIPVRGLAFQADSSVRPNAASVFCVVCFDGKTGDVRALHGAVTL